MALRDSIAPPTDPFATVDVAALARDLDDLHAAVQAGRSAADFRHLRKIERWGRLCSAVGLATAWLWLNPLSALLISQGIFTRWAIVAHHVLHRGYDTVPDIPARYTSRAFARGRRRWIDWFDWILPAAWVHEHNLAHHYHLGEARDPDQVELNVRWLREWRAPLALKLAALLALAASWKFVYYAGNTILAWKRPRAPRTRENRLGDPRFWGPWTATGRLLWGQCLVPYSLWTFVVLPALFLPLGTTAAVNVLLTMLAAEILTNLHSFAVIVTNHAGDDLYAFAGKASGRPEFYLRQIAGSTNFRCGGDLNDFAHGWLNYQVEHHLWPNLTLLQYRRAQAGVRAICARHGIAYTQEPVWARVRKTVDVMIGRTSMSTVTGALGAAREHRLY